MKSTHDNGTSGVPRWSAPWAAGWSAMSDLSRVETDVQSFHTRAPQPDQANPVRRNRAFGLVAGTLAAVWIVAAIWL